MKLQLFTVWDSAAQRYLEPFFAATVEVALRMFRSVVNTEGHQFNRFPEDYTLFHLGEFDQEDGRLSVEHAPHSLGVALTFIERSRYDELVNAGAVPGAYGDRPKVVNDG